MPIRIYVPSAPTSDLEQGEIISDLFSLVPNSPREIPENPELTLVEHPFAIILTQSCDLVRRDEVPEPDRNILFCELLTEAVALPTFKEGSKFITSVKKNQHHRYQYLCGFSRSDDALLVGSGSPGLYIDFRSVFTLSAGEVAYQLENAAKRRCSLKDLYREHLASRYAYFISRVALPIDHHRERNVAIADPALPSSTENTAAISIDDA